MVDRILHWFEPIPVKWQVRFSVETLAINYGGGDRTETDLWKHKDFQLRTNAADFVKAVKEAGGAAYGPEKIVSHD